LYFGYRKHLALLNDEDRGRLLMALFDYAESGRTPDFDGAVAMAFSFIQDQMDRDASKYAAVCERNRENGAKGGRPPKAKKTKENPHKPKITERFFEKPKKPDDDYEYDNDPENDNEYEDDVEYDSDSEKRSIGAAAPAPAKTGKHKHGTYGWVLLTNEEYNRLLDELGEAELKRCIEYVDESAQATGNKNKWKDWNLVIRKCNKQRWGMNKTYEEVSKYGAGVNRQYSRSGDGTFSLSGFKPAGDED